MDGRVGFAEGREGEGVCLCDCLGLGVFLEPVFFVYWAWAGFWG